MTGKLAILPGDGVGPEVIAQARRVLDWVLANRNFALHVTGHDFGLACYAKTGELMTPEMRADVMAADAVLFGAMGGPEYDKIPREIRHRGGVLGLRTGMKVFANLRPAIGFTEIADAVPLKERVIDGVDLLLVREANGGLYVAQPRGIETMADGQERGVNTMAYTTDEVKRVARVAFRLAEQRSGRLCSVDKSNVLEVSNVWHNAVIAVHRDEFPDIELSHLFVDNCAMQLIRDPRQFDVLVTDNIFGDILSDGSAAIMGSLGMAKTSLAQVQSGPIGAEKPRMPSRRSAACRRSSRCCVRSTRFGNDMMR